MARIPGISRQPSFTFRPADYLPEIITPPPELAEPPIHPHAFYHTSGDAAKKTLYLQQQLRRLCDIVMTREGTEELHAFGRKLQVALEGAASLLAFLEKKRGIPPSIHLESISCRDTIEVTPKNPASLIRRGR